MYPLEVFQSLARIYTPVNIEISSDFSSTFVLGIKLGDNFGTITLSGALVRMEGLFEPWFVALVSGRSDHTHNLFAGG